MWGGQHILTHRANRNRDALHMIWAHRYIRDTEWSDHKGNYTGKRFWSLQLLPWAHDNLSKIQAIWVPERVVLEWRGPSSRLKPAAPICSTRIFHCYNSTSLTDLKVWFYVSVMKTKCHLRNISCSRMLLKCGQQSSMPTPNLKDSVAAMSSFSWIITRLKN